MDYTQEQIANLYLRAEEAKMDYTQEQIANLYLRAAQLRAEGSVRVRAKYRLRRGPWQDLDVVTDGTGDVAELPPGDWLDYDNATVVGACAHSGPVGLDGRRMTRRRVYGSDARSYAYDTKEKVVMRGCYRGAGLKGAPLNGVDARGADFTGADLSDASLIGADLRGANLTRANLESADISYACLDRAQARNARLARAVLNNARLDNADFSDADLRGAYIQRAWLNDASLAGADLRGTCLQHTTLINAVLDGAQTDPSTDWGPRPVLAEGAITVWKKVLVVSQAGFVEDRVVLEMVVPAGAARVWPYTSPDKCRVSEALPIAAWTCRREPHVLRHGLRYRSAYEQRYPYRIGEASVPAYYEPSPLVTCAGGVHVFATFAAARNHRV